MISTHLPEDQAELFLRVGETILVLEDFSDGWMAGKMQIILRENISFIINISRSETILHHFLLFVVSGMEKGTNRMGLFPTRCVLKL